MCSLKNFSLPFLLLLSSHLLETKTLHPEESGGLFEGDIELPEEEEELLESGELSAGIVGEHYRWDHATIPYEISNEFNNADVSLLKGAMLEISRKTCIKFKPHERERDYIIFRNGEGCSSYVGRRGGQQTVNISRPGCVQHGVVIHELVHAIGFWHEQSRTDRDDFVTINLNNVKPKERHNYNKYTTKEANDFGAPYDFDSIMHYSDTAFISQEAKDRNGKTIIPKKNQNRQWAQIGQRKFLSYLDALKINKMYQCPNRLGLFNFLFWRENL